MKKENVMDLSLAKCEILMEVVETGSLTAAAKRYGITQSAVSHSIAGLEDVFRRTTQKWTFGC